MPRSRLLCGHGGTHWTVTVEPTRWFLYTHNRKTCEVIWNGEVHRGGQENARRRFRVSRAPTITEPPFPKSCNSIFHWAHPFAFSNSEWYKLSNSTSYMSMVFLEGWFCQGLVVGVWHRFWPHLFQKCHRMSHRGKDFVSASRKSRFGRLELVLFGAHANCLWILWNLGFNMSYCIQVYHKIRERRSGQESSRRSVVCKVTHFEASVPCHIQLFWHIKYQKNHAYVGYSN